MGLDQKIWKIKNRYALTYDSMSCLLINEKTKKRKIVSSDDLEDELFPEDEEGVIMDVQFEVHWGVKKEELTSFSNNYGMSRFFLELKCMKDGLDPFRLGGIADIGCIQVEKGDLELFRMAAALADEEDSEGMRRLYNELRQFFNSKSSKTHKLYYYEF